MKDGLIGHLFIPGRLPGLNEILEARLTIRHDRPKPSNGRRQWNAYTQLKARWTKDIRLHILAQRFPILQEAHFTYLFDEFDKKRDPSNFTAGGVKFIEDAMQHAGSLENDGWRQVLGYRSFWRVNRDRAGVHVFATSDDCMTFEEAVFEADRPVNGAAKLDLSPLEFE